MSDRPVADVTIWTDVDRVSRIDHVLRLMGPAIRPIGIGGPRQAPIGQLASRLACRHEDDLRKLLVDCPAQFVLLGSMSGVGPEDVRTALGQGSIVLTLEPVASEISELIGPKPRTPVSGTRTSAFAAGGPGGDGPPTKGQIVWIPGFDHSPGWTAATDPAQVLGAPRVISISSFGQPEDCSLFARLYDAWTMVLSLGDIPEEIDASLSGPLSEVPENLRGLTGHIAAHSRLGNGCTTVLAVSDRAGRLGRVLHVIGDQGHLRVSDTGYQLHNEMGQCIDHLTEPEQIADFADLIAWHWTHLINHPVMTAATPANPASATHTMVLGCCLACLLSARTGHPESPAKLLQLHHL